MSNRKMYKVTGDVLHRFIAHIYAESHDDAESIIRKMGEQGGLVISGEPSVRIDLLRALDEEELGSSVDS